MARIASGGKFRDGNFATPSGSYLTFHKRPSRHMAAGNLAANGYDLPGVPWISYITESGIAFHGTYWHNNGAQSWVYQPDNSSSKWIIVDASVVPPQEQMLYKIRTSVRIARQENLDMPRQPLAGLALMKKITPGGSLVCDEPCYAVKYWLPRHILSERSTARCSPDERDGRRE
jgi:hypothetical protein